MLLAIDAGNTNTVFAIVEEGAIVNSWRCSTSEWRTGDEYFVWLMALLNSGRHAVEVDSVIISCVVPNVLLNLKRLCASHFGIEPLIVGEPECELPVAIRVDKHTQVGADRLVNTVAAYDCYGGDLIVVDFGTATTFDVVDSDGAYIGGAISPGIELSLKALHHAAAALPLIGVERPASAIGKNTRDCMYSGIYWGYVGLIEGICSRIQDETQRKMKVIGTGGLASVLASDAGPFDYIDKELTMYGLSLIHTHNRN